MDKETFLEELLTELSYRSDEGYPDFKKDTHIQLLSEIMDDWGLSDIKNELISNLISEAEDEEETVFKNSTLNKEVEYTDSEGNTKTGKVGNLLRQPEGTPPREAAEAELSGMSDEERDEIDDELGSQRGNQTDPDMEFDGEKEDEEGGEGQEEEPQDGTALKPDTKGGQDYYDSLPDNDPAKKANKDQGNQTLYSVGGGYYSSSPDGEAEFVRTEGLSMTEMKAQNQKGQEIEVVPIKDDEELTGEQKQELLQADHETTDRSLNMTKKEAKAQASKKGKKGVGAGTAVSRAGEAMVHKGIRLLNDGKDLETIEAQFRDIVNTKGHILNSKSGKKWVDATISSLKQIDYSIGIDNIDTVAWDTPQGRTAIGVSKDLETSSDMFVRTKEGKNVGVSLKKTGKVFLNNGGWAKQSEILLDKLKGNMPEDDHERLEEAMSIEAYNEDLTKRINDVTDKIDAKTIAKDFERLQNDEQMLKKYFGGKDKEKYFDSLRNPEVLIKRLNMGTSGPSKDDQPSNYDTKGFIKLLQAYHEEEYKYLREVDNGLTQRTFDVLNSSPKAKLGMNKHIIKSMHVAETLGLSDEIKEGGVDNFVTVYGIDPDGAILDERSLITLFGSDFKQRLDEVVTEVRSGDGDYSDIEKFISDQIEINYDTGEILFHHESNKKFPLFYMAGRARSLGAAPVMEMAQTTFMAHALKVGTFNVDEWDEKSKKQFEDDIRDIEDEEEEDIEATEE